MLYEFVGARVAEVASCLLALVCCIVFVASAADVVYYILVALRILKWDPKNSPFRAVPFERRLQTLSCNLVACVIFISMLFGTYCLINLRKTWWWIIPYMTYCVLDKTHVRGGRKFRPLRQCFLYLETAKYFPTKLIKWHEETLFPADRSYLFGFHPVKSKLTTVHLLES